MKETEALVRIQQIDLAVMRNKRKLANMPQAKRVQAVVAARKKLATQISKIVGQRKDAQMDLDENEAAHASLKEDVSEIQRKYAEGAAGYRELADLQAQLTSLAKRMEKLEFMHPKLEERLLKIQVAEQNALDMDKRLRDEGTALIESLKRDSADVEADLKSLAKERAAIVGNLSDEVLGRYEESAKRFGGLAVETLRGNQPSVCCVTIPPSSFGDIQRGPAITTCPYCHRMLVTDGMFGLEQ